MQFGIVFRGHHIGTGVRALSEFAAQGRNALAAARAQEEP